MIASRPTIIHLHKARGAVFDVRKLKSTVVKHERPEDRGPNHAQDEASSVAPRSAAAPRSASAPAPGPDNSFDGLDFATWGNGHPPDTNGDVGPTYYIQAINTSLGIFDKSTGNRVAAFTFNALMSQGHFGNLCDTNNFGDPVVLYDSFEDRWFVTDFAFTLDSGGNVNPQHVFQCFAVSKTSDPVTGGWNFYSIESPGGLDDYPKFGVWPDGIYMSANMFGYGRGAAFISPHVWGIDKAQMYAGNPSVQVVDFAAPGNDFTLLPANARLQAGTPPAGTPEYFASTEEFTNALTVYKLNIDWTRVSASTFTGPDTPMNATSWPNAAVPNAPTQGGNSLDTLQIRAMAQDQYSNLGGAESLWVDHTVRRQNTTGFAAPRWYQVNVTGGTVAANTLQGTTWDPDGANTFYRFVPSLAVDRAGDLAMGYSISSATTKPGIDYAGRLGSDPANTFSQGEQSLIQGTGTQTGTCAGATCSRWGDYTGMALDPNGCEFWMTNEYYVANGLNFLTRIGSFHFPGCTPVGNGTLSGTVSTAGGNRIAGATIALGSRTTTTDGSGKYSFTIPAGTYPSLSASQPGFDSSSATDVVVPNGATATKDFTLTAAATSGCFTDNTQAAFQTGTPNGCDLTTTPGSVQLARNISPDQSNSSIGTSGVGITITTWGGQTFTPATTAPLTKIDVNLFCSGCTGTTPDLTLSIRATSGGLPTGADLASAAIAGFSSGASGYHTATFATPITLTAGTQYAFVIHPTANPSPGTYALTRSGTSTAGSDVYSRGTRVAGASSGTVWSIPLTGGVSTDTGFRIYLDTGFPASGTFVSSVKDANPPPNSRPTWTTLSFTATTPVGTGVKFQIAASNSPSGPFTFVGPDGTANTYFTASGASLSQFDGFRYLRYEAFLTTSDSSTTPTLSSVQVCFNDAAPGPSDVVISELRPGSDGFVALMNRKSVPWNMQGWRLDARGNDNSSAASVTLPAQTIAPRGTLLVTAPGYSLGEMAASDDSLGAQLPADGSVALIDPANATQDAVRFAAATVFGEGDPLGTFAPGGQYAFVRRANRTGTGDAYGLPTDTNDNAADFALVVPEGQTGSAGSALPSIEGVPGPGNLNSPQLANAALQVGLLDPGVASNVAPNRQIVDPDGAGPLPQTLYLRRTVTNISGAPLTALGFRVTAITTARSDPVAGQSVLRLDSSDNTTVSGKTITPLSLQRTTQTPLPHGGGLNAIVTVPSITPSAPLAPGASINVEFALRIAQSGAFQVIFNTEAQKATSP